MDCAVGEIVEFGRLSMRDWAQLIEGEHQPFGAICAGFAFRPKDHHVGIRDVDGRLLAAAGWSLVDVEIAGAGALQVVGVGALIVRQDLRGRGLAEPIMDRVRERIRRTPGAYRMLLCEPHLEPLYARRGYRPVEDPVWVDQSDGPVLWPLRAMWAPLTSSAGWPAGVVRIQGLPF